MTGPRPHGKREETAWERKRRLARVFGEALPETTRDERDEAEGAGGRSLRSEDEDPGDAWLRDQVPPHHG